MGTIIFAVGFLIIILAIAFRKPLFRAFFKGVINFYQFLFAIVMIVIIIAVIAVIVFSIWGVAITH